MYQGKTDTHNATETRTRTTHTQKPERKTDTDNVTEPAAGKAEGGRAHRTEGKEVVRLHRGAEADVLFEDDLGVCAVAPDLVGAARVGVVHARVVGLQAPAVVPVPAPVRPEHG